MHRSLVGDRAASAQSPCLRMTNLFDSPVFSLASLLRSGQTAQRMGSSPVAAGLRNGVEKIGRGAGEDAPSLPKLLKHPAGGAVGIEVERSPRREGLDRQNVPEPLRNEVSRQKVDVFFGVDGRVPLCADEILVALARGGRLHLHALKAVASIDDEVVGIALSPGLGDLKAEVAGFGEKGGFDGFSATLAMVVSSGLNF